MAQRYSHGQDPKDCWDREITLFTSSHESRKKGCPKSAFLGLCQDGFVKGIPQGSYVPVDSPNKKYATIAANVVLDSSSRHYSNAELWHKATTGFSGAAKNQNGQMDVVLALKEAGLLKKPN
nr:hypothetical protein [Candidatus Symbiopectobacterium sp. NZEC127]